MSLPTGHDAPMIPYIAQPRFHAIGLTFYAFGFLVATALLAGWWMLLRRAQRFGLDRGKVERLTFHMLWWGYYGSHVLYLLLFRRADLALRPWLLLNPLDGIYSFGGIVCGTLAAIWFAHRYQFTRMQFWRYLDVAGFVFPFSWTIARIGCALAHDHVGMPNTSWIAVRFPEGPRLGLAGALLLRAVLLRLRSVPALAGHPSQLAGYAGPLIRLGLGRRRLRHVDAGVAPSRATQQWYLTYVARSAGASFAGTRGRSSDCRSMPPNCPTAG